MTELRVERAVAAAAGCTVLRLAEHRDARGGLAVAELGDGLPFAPTRVFAVHGVPPGARRGEHANRTVHELLIAVSGSVTVDVDDTRERATFVLDEPALALHLPPLVWSVQRDFSPGSVLVVLASDPWDPGDAIRDRDELARLARGR